MQHNLGMSSITNATNTLWQNNATQEGSSSSRTISTINPQQYLGVLSNQAENINHPETNQTRSASAIDTLQQASIETLPSQEKIEQLEKLISGNTIDLQAGRNIIGKDYDQWLNHIAQNIKDKETIKRYIVLMDYSIPRNYPRQDWLKYTAIKSALHANTSVLGWIAENHIDSLREAVNDKNQDLTTIVINSEYYSEAPRIDATKPDVVRAELETAKANIENLQVDIEEAKFQILDNRVSFDIIQQSATLDTTDILIYFSMYIAKLQSDGIDDTIINDNIDQLIKINDELNTAIKRYNAIEGVHNSLEGGIDGTSELKAAIDNVVELEASIKKSDVIKFLLSHNGNNVFKPQNEDKEKKTSIQHALDRRCKSEGNDVIVDTLLTQYRCNQITTKGKAKTSRDDWPFTFYPNYLYTNFKDPRLPRKAFLPTIILSLAHESTNPKTKKDLERLAFNCIAMFYKEIIVTPRTIYTIAELGSYGKITKLLGIRNDVIGERKVCREINDQKIWCVMSNHLISCMPELTIDKPQQRSQSLQRRQLQQTIDFQERIKFKNN